MLCNDILNFWFLECQIDFNFRRCESTCVEPLCLYMNQNGIHLHVFTLLKIKMTFI